LLCTAFIISDVYTMYGVKGAHQPSYKADTIIWLTQHWLNIVG